MTTKGIQAHVQQRIAKLERANSMVLVVLRREGFSDREIASMEPREIFGRVCIDSGVCTIDNGMTLFDVAEQILSVKTSPLQKQLTTKSPASV